MDLSSLLDHPLLDNPLKIICYLRGANVRLTGKNVLFLQLEYYASKNKNVQPTTSLKDLCSRLWDSASLEQRRNFESMAHIVNLADERFKRRNFQRHRNEQISRIDFSNI